MTVRRSRSRRYVVGSAVVLAMATTALTGPARASAGGPGQPVGRTGHEETRQALDAVVRAGIPGITAQSRSEDGIWKGAAGVGNLKTGAPRGADDRFRIASITKTFVATVMLQLEAEKRLDLDGTVESWLPGVVRGHGHDGRKITVRQLLNHTSGIFDFTDDPGYARRYLGTGFLKHRYDTRSPKVAVDAAMAHAPAFEPGTRYAYSNTNYVLAGLIMERVTGRTYEHEIRTRIIKPLKLHATLVPGDSSRMPKPSSRAYSTLGDDTDAARVHDVTVQNASQTWAEGDMISDAGDLHRFFSALMRGRLLAPEQLKAMKTTVFDSGYGLGIEQLTTSCGTTLWGHGGGWIGSLSYAATTDDGSHALAFNLNGDWSSAGMGRVLEAEFCGVATHGTASEPVGPGR
ncbi:beta-lactamase family protein [Streptomyces sp. NBC_01433]|uniref:serine hydrolase domain-containing protein n=1 Tax=Streptomyces sp. NBC_01433 TaxID=2903864 RepID=UPI0022552DDD|nr:serine hydrolase domain-containing protein [Streptomyces sp. NBC_01433]MCX4681091.1 beta-lactamase family protein [Streptomyces sp. NBC_01433]